MDQFNAVYSVSDRPIEDFFIGEPTLPEDRQKTSGWKFTITNIYTPGADEYQLGTTTISSHVEGDNHE